MPEYAIGIEYHEPMSFALRNLGMIEDYEASTCLFIDADSVEEAIAWGEKVGSALLRYVNKDDSLDWKGFNYVCWLEEPFQESPWQHCRDFFQHVRAGQWPNIEGMTTASYVRWIEQKPEQPALDLPSESNDTTR